MEAWRSLGEMLAIQAQVRGDRPAVAELDAGGAIAHRVTYAELDRDAGAVAALLAAQGLRAGDRALLAHGPGLALVRALAGCFRAGVVPVVAPISSYARSARTRARLGRLLADARPEAALVEAAGRAWLTALLGEHEPVRVVATDEAVAGAAAPAAVGPDDVALLQYTSGSTAAPRGVVLTHRAVLANLAAIVRIIAPDEASRVLMWVPPYHDMGLVGGILTPLAGGFETLLMHPSAFARRPGVWMEAIARHRATVTAGPCFAFAQAARADTPPLDLSCLAIAFVGAERVSPGVLDAFDRRFGPAGLAPGALYPCYGMAEATLLVAGAGRGARWRARAFAAAALEAGRVEPARDGEAARELTAIGPALDGHRVRILDPASLVELAADRVGEVAVEGPSLASGYFEKAEATASAFVVNGDGARLLRTGDLGFLQDGELYLVGRLKELIIVNGRNIAAQDVECTVEAAHPALEPGGAVAFSLDTPEGEAVGIVCEATREGRRQLAEAGVVEAVRRAVLQDLDLAVHALDVVAPGTLPRTTSGKLQRALAAKLASGALEPLIRYRRSATERAPEPAPASPEELARATVARMLGVPAAAVDLSLSPDELGLDSVQRIELAATLFGGGAHERAAQLVRENVSVASLLTGFAPRPAGPGEPLAPGTEVPLPPRPARALELGQASQRGFGTLVQLLVSPAARERLPAALEIALGARDALRMGFRRQDGRFVQFVRPPGPALRLTVEDVSGLPPGAFNASREQRLGELTGAVDLEAGPLAAAALFDRGPGARSVLWLFVHHLVSDATSIALLLEDVERALENGTAPGGDGYVAWCRALVQAREDPLTRALVPGWAAVVFPAGTAAGTEAPSFHAWEELVDPDRTTRLIAACGGSAGVRAVLLAALARALARAEGPRSRVVMLQHHGREPAGGVDPLLTVGWIALRYPVRVEVPPDDSLSAWRAVAERALTQGPRPVRTFELVRDELPADRRCDATLEYRGSIDDEHRLTRRLRLIGHETLSPPEPEPDRDDLMVSAGVRRGQFYVRVTRRGGAPGSSAPLARAIVDDLSLAVPIVR